MLNLKYSFLIRHKGKLLCNNHSVYSAKIYCHELFNKQADKLLAEQDKVSVKSQSENDGKKKSSVRGDASQSSSK